MIDRSGRRWPKPCGPPANDAGERLTPNCGEALFHGRPFGQPLLIGDDIEAAARRLQQFSRAQQEIRIAGPAIGLIAVRKGLVQQHAAGFDRGHNVAEKRPPQIVDDQDGGKAA